MRTTSASTAPAWLDGVVLVTGASSGIGASLARQAARTASVVVLVARRRERLDELARELESLDRPDRPPVRVDVRPADLADADGVQALADEVLAEHGRVDVLVNNAGFGDYGLVEGEDPAVMAQMVAVNVTAPTLLARAVLPGMVERRLGALLMVGSSAGRLPMPGAVVYSATKFYVKGLSAGLRSELAGTGVTLTELAPGPVATEFDDVSGMGPLTGAVGFTRIGPDQCAAEAWAGLVEGTPVVYPGAVMRTLMRAQTLVPLPAMRPLLGGLGRLQRHSAARGTDRRALGR